MNSFYIFYKVFEMSQGLIVAIASVGFLVSCGLTCTFACDYFISRTILYKYVGKFYPDFSKEECCLTMIWVWGLMIVASYNAIQNPRQLLVPILILALTAGGSILLSMYQRSNTV